MRVPTKEFSSPEEPLRYYRTTGLMVTQMQELVRRVNNALDKPWNKRVGRPKSLGLYKAVEAACMYLRQSASQEFIGDVRDTSQPTISRYLAALVPLVKSVLEEFVPSAADAIEVARGRVVLVDGTLTPCWSYEEHQELWNKKHKTTGFNAQLISLLDGTAVWISGPLPGKTHDAKAFKETGAADILKEAGGGFGDKGYQGTGLVTPKKKPKGGELTLSDKEYNSQISSFRAPIERLVGHFKNWKMFHTDYRRPYSTYHDAFDAARALFFFSTCLSVHARMRSASCRLFLSCISMWLFPRMPSAGRCIISASPPALFNCCTNVWQLSNEAAQLAGPPRTSPR